jgi:hypothetical protein
MAYNRIEVEILSNFKKYSLVLAAIFYFSLLVSACSLRSPISDVDRSALSLGVYGKACWEGLCPEVSTKSEVINSLTQLSFVTPNTIQFYEDSWLETETSSRVIWDCQESPSRWCGEAIFSNEVLHFLWLRLNRDLTIGQFTNVYGTPDSVIYFDDPWDTSCELKLIWIKKGLIANSNAHKTCSDLISQSASIGISSGFRIRSISLSSEMAMADILEDMVSVLHPWPGMSDSTISNIQLIPGNYSMWAISLITFALVPILGTLKPNIKSALIAFPIAGITVFGPTLAFQFSDICIPTIYAWLINTTLLGILYMGMIEGSRLIRSRFKSPLT